MDCRSSAISRTVPRAGLNAFVLRKGLTIVTTSGGFKSSSAAIRPWRCQRQLPQIRLFTLTRTYGAARLCYVSAENCLGPKPAPNRLSINHPK
jgi:hypothetical protein